MSATTGPASSVFRELVVDIGLTTGADRQACDHFKYVRRTSGAAHGAKEYLHLSIELVDSFVELDMPAAQRSANHDATFHARSIAQTGQKSPSNTLKNRGASGCVPRFRRDGHG